jgi:starch synthase (maltosyl-transferring)
MAAGADNIERIEFWPGGFQHRLQYSVFSIRIRVHGRRTGEPAAFRVIVRTNLNQARRIRRQIIDMVEKGQSYSTDFYDIPAHFDAERGEYVVEVLLCEVGYFEFKVRVESSRRSEGWVRWADGANVGVSVCPVDYGRDNAIYCAFIRQYVPDKHKESLRDEPLEKTISQLESQGAYVLPPGGNFENFKKELPFIIGELGMRIIHLLPINPVPASYGRMGLYGSPYATTDYFGIDHTYGTFSRYKTIEEQFIDLTSTIHHLGAKVILDMVINHTGWASSIHFTHRHWKKVGDDRKILSPGAWGVVWEDLVELDYQHKDLWRYMAEVFLAWCRRGIDGYRLDAGYKIDLEVWQYIISKVRQEFPQTLFLLEGLGGPWETTETLLTKGQMDWAYSEMFQNYTRQQITQYLDYARWVSESKGTLVHYAETHDNDRLAKKGRTYARMRVYLSALTSFAGAWGITNGVEWLATEKIDVHRNTALRWGNPENLVEDIRKLNRILGENPAFWIGSRLEAVRLADPDLFAFVRRDPAGTNLVAGIINLSMDRAIGCRWDWLAGSWAAAWDRTAGIADLLNDGWQAGPANVIFDGELEPGGCRLYRLNQAAEEAKPAAAALFDMPAERVKLIYQILLSRFKPHEAGRIDQEKLLRCATDFRQFIALINTTSLADLVRGDALASPPHFPADLLDRYSSVWTFRESHKEFIIPGDKWLVVDTFVPCTAYLKADSFTITVDSLPVEGASRHECFFRPFGENQRAKLTFNWKIERRSMVQRQWQEDGYPILSVPASRSVPRFASYYPLALDRERLRAGYTKILLTSGAGAISQFPALPGSLDSKYDALLAIARRAEDPSDRVALARGIRETVQVERKFFDLDSSFLKSFFRFPCPKWTFAYDDGEFVIRLEKAIVMPPGENAVYVQYRLLDSNTPISIFSKFAVELRNPHDLLAGTAAMAEKYAQATRVLADRPGVVFAPEPGRQVRLEADEGQFLNEPHWVYQTDFAEDAERKLPSRGDAYVPGVFRFKLNNGDSRTVMITAQAEPPARIAFSGTINEHNKHGKMIVDAMPVASARRDPRLKMLLHALDQFLVRTDRGWILLSGYPWLGMRVADALRCVPGLLAANRAQESLDIVCRCADTEKDGLLIDWIFGGPEGRTSLEASLRLILAVDELAVFGGDESFVDSMLVSGKTLRQILADIFKHFRAGIPNGPDMDPDSGMIYSPPNFSWMNTTYPTATPRPGYCVEHQVLWHQSLAVIARLCPEAAEEALRIRELIGKHFNNLFWIDSRGYLSDVLLAPADLPARQASPDMACRCNQIEALDSGLMPPDNVHKAIEIIGRRLMVPGAIRTLSEDPLTTPLRITDERGKLLVDPRMPYSGRCVGDETARRIAYHNGTAWPMFYPRYLEARTAAWDYSDQAINHALAFFEPVWQSLCEGGIGTLPEMKDGNFPHATRGCYAHAPSVAEALRVYWRLKYTRLRE